MNHTENRIAWHTFAQFCFTTGMQRLVLAYFSNVKGVVSATKNDWECFFSELRETNKKKRLTKEEEIRILLIASKDHGKSFEELEKQKIQFVTEDELFYPAVLSKTFDHPHWLYYLGELPKPDEPLLSIIGARKCTPYGSSVARNFAMELSSAGVGIISGLAYGVDRAAHEGALKGRGKTYAVLGNGVDICYPQTNLDIYSRILDGNGAILSEYPPGMHPLPMFFPQRNRIIAGMGDGILVTEARKQSGTLITVSFGLEYGKNIYSVPGRITDPLSEGCNQLLSEGARPVCRMEDILTDMNWNQFLPNFSENNKKGEKCEKIEKILASPEKIVYASLRLRPKHMEELLTETGFSIAELSTILHSLCLGGYIRRIGQAMFAVSGEEKGFLPER